MDCWVSTQTKAHSEPTREARVLVIISFAHFFNKYLLSTCCVLGIQREAVLASSLPSSVPEAGGGGDTNTNRISWRLITVVGMSAWLGKRGSWCRGMLLYKQLIFQSETEGLLSSSQIIIRDLSAFSVIFRDLSDEARLTWIIQANPFNSRTLT